MEGRGAARDQEEEEKAPIQGIINDVNYEVSQLLQNLQEDSPGRRNAKSQSGIASRRSKAALRGIDSGSTALRADNKSEDNNTVLLYVKRESDGAKLNSESGTASVVPVAHHSELVGVSKHIHEE